MERNELIVSAELFGHSITARVVKLDDGLSVLITGGCLSHVGAVSIADADGLHRIVRPTHKDQFVSDKWAEKLNERFCCPVCVTGGIHYDDILPEQITEVLIVTDDLLNQVITMLEKSSN